jgi:hypothetical protein
LKDFGSVSPVGVEFFGWKNIDSPESGSRSESSIVWVLIDWKTLHPGPYWFYVSPARGLRLELEAVLELELRKKPELELRQVLETGLETSLPNWSSNSSWR